MTANAKRPPAPGVSNPSRHRAREAALQMLYQGELGRLSMSEVRQTFWRHPGDEEVPPLAGELRALAEALAEGVAAHLAEIDPLIADSAEHWRLERMAVMDRLVLRLAVYEFLHERDTPARVVINEALELARTFSGDEAVPFINGVLDAIRRKLERA